MRRLLVKSLISNLVVLLLIGAFSTSTFAASHVQPTMLKVKNMKTVCVHQSVHLNGLQNPTISCLDTIQAKSGNAHPNIDTVDCSQALVELSVPFDDDTLCISGDGFLNLDKVFQQCSVTHYWTCGTSWGGLAENYNLYGCATNAGIAGNTDYPGYFSWDIGGDSPSYFKNMAKSGSFNYNGPYSLLINC